MVPHQGDNRRPKTVFVWPDGFQQSEIVNTRNWVAGGDGDSGRLTPGAPEHQDHRQDDQSGFGSGARQSWFSRHPGAPEIDPRHLSWPGPARYLAQQALNRPPTPWAGQLYPKRQGLFPGPDMAPSPPRHISHWLNHPHRFNKLPGIPQPFQQVVGSGFEPENAHLRHSEPDDRGNDSRNIDAEYGSPGFPEHRQPCYEAGRHNFRTTSFPTILAQHPQPDSAQDNEIHQRGLARHLVDLGLQVPPPSGKHKEPGRPHEIPVEQLKDIPPPDLENDADREDDPDLEGDSDWEDYSIVGDDPKPLREPRQTIWSTVHPTPSNSSLTEPKEWGTGFDTISDVEALLSPSILGPLSLPATPDTKERDFTWIQEVQGAVTELGMLINGAGYPDIRDGWRGDIKNWLEEQVNVKERPEDQIWKGSYYNELSRELDAVRNGDLSTVEILEETVEVMEVEFAVVGVGPVELPGSEDIETERKIKMAELHGAFVDQTDAFGGAETTPEATTSGYVVDRRRCRPFLNHGGDEDPHADLAAIGVEDGTDEDPIPEEYRPRNEGQKERVARHNTWRIWAKMQKEWKGKEKCARN